MGLISSKVIISVVFLLRPEILQQVLCCDQKYYGKGRVSAGTRNTTARVESLLVTEILRQGWSFCWDQKYYGKGRVSAGNRNTTARVESLLETEILRQG